MYKVGLITIHRVKNFGSALQTVALFHSITQLGYECSVIDYKYPNKYHKDKYKAPKLSLTYILRLILSSKDELFKHFKFKRFIRKNLRLTKCYISCESLSKNPPIFDIFVTGSDQVWNPKYCLDDTSFLLSFTSSHRKIAYAASFGSNQFAHYYIEKYRSLLKQYQAISVREESGIQLVQKICGQKATNVLDPTLLLNKEQWMNFCPQPKTKHPYILCYILGYSFQPYPWAYKLIDHIQKLTKYKIVMIYGSSKLKFRQNYIIKNDIGPEEFIGLYANASFVITSSFHGTAFAINFNRPFLSIINDQQTSDDRQIQILRQMRLMQCAIAKNSAMPDKSCLQVDFSQTNQILETQRDFSINYLRNALRNCCE